MKYFFIIISKTWNDALGVVVAVAVVVVSRAVVGWFGGAGRGGGGDEGGDTDGAGPGSRLDQTVVSSPVFGGGV